MNLNCSNTTKEGRLSKLSAIFNRQPELLYKNPYINFLREFRIRHLDLELTELYHEGAVAWTKLTNKEKRTFRYLDVIKDVKHRQAMKDLRSKLEKKRKRAKSLMSHRAMKSNKRKLYPLRNIAKRQKRTKNRIDKKTTKSQKPLQKTERIRKIFESLRSLNKIPKTGRRRQRRSQRRRMRRQNVGRRRQIKRRK